MYVAIADLLLRHVLTKSSLLGAWRLVLQKQGPLIHHPTLCFIAGYYNLEYEHYILLRI